MSFDEIEQQLESIDATIKSIDSDTSRAVEISGHLQRIGEDVLIQWITARNIEPTNGKREGFRLLALHRQSCKGEPSFNACRETCRELCYYHNLVASDPHHPEIGKRLMLATLVAKHLFLFVSGKMQVENLGEFCCSSRPVRSADADVFEVPLPD